MENYCVNCRYFNEERNFPYVDCLYHDRWEGAVPIWVKKWLSSFDTASATECFTAVNLLKQRLEGEDEYNSRN